MIVHKNVSEPWKVTLVDTGYNTQTGGRLAQVKQYVKDETFLMTYGDGLSDVNLPDTVKHHKAHGKVATITAVQPGGRFGVLELNENNDVQKFAEKAKSDGGWVNAGFMVFEPEIFNYLGDNNCILEREPMNMLAKNKQLSAYKHHGYWQCMDTLREKERLEWLLQEKRAPWKVWSD
jgi:glucose-1-phosphate cytidylyltransferase